MKEYCVYHISPNSDLADGYIGVTNNFHKRRKEHMRDKQNNKYNRKAIAMRQHDVLEEDFRIIMTGTLHECYAMEKELRPESYSGWNTNLGGQQNTGYNATVETRNRMSVAQMGKTVSDETRQRMSKAQHGKTMSADAIAKTTAANTGRVASISTCEKISKANIGKILSQKTKDKISKANSGSVHHYYGKTRSQETKDKISKTLTGKKHSDETKEKMSRSRIGKGHPKFKGYYHTPLGIYESALQASLANSCSDMTVHNRCKSNKPKFETWFFEGTNKGEAK